MRVNRVEKERRHSRKETTVKSSLCCLSRGGGEFPVYVHLRCIEASTYLTARGLQSPYVLSVSSSMYNSSELPQSPFSMLKAQCNISFSFFFPQLPLRPEDTAEEDEVQWAAHVHEYLSADRYISSLEGRAPRINFSMDQTCSTIRRKPFSSHEHNRPDPPIGVAWRFPWTPFRMAVKRRRREEGDECTPPFREEEEEVRYSGHSSAEESHYERLSRLTEAEAPGGVAAWAPLRVVVDFSDWLEGLLLYRGFIEPSDWRRYHSRLRNATFSSFGCTYTTTVPQQHSPSVVAFLARSLFGVGPLPISVPVTTAMERIFKKFREKESRQQTEEFEGRSQ